MERVCSNCHAVLGKETKADWCPACGGALVERAELPQNSTENPPHTVDHRGIVLPRRHALGGIITPQ
jgi:predicted amidophosphoribosyltransferase